jgi:hypothetical protein
VGLDCWDVFVVSGGYWRESFMDSSLSRTMAGERFLLGHRLLRHLPGKLALSQLCWRSGGSCFDVTTHLMDASFLKD